MLPARVGLVVCAQRKSPIRAPSNGVLGFPRCTYHVMLPCLYLLSGTQNTFSKPTSNSISTTNTTITTISDNLLFQRSPDCRWSPFCLRLVPKSWFRIRCASCRFYSRGYAPGSKGRRKLAAESVFNFTHIQHHDPPITDQLAFHNHHPTVDSPTYPHLLFKNN